MRRASQDSMEGRQTAAGSIAWLATSSGHPSGMRRAIASCDDHRPGTLLRRFSWPSSNSYKLPSFRDSYGELGTNRGRFSLSLALKTPLERNNVDRLGLFWIVF